MVQVLEKLPPGRALDLAAGAGGIAIRLAQMGWHVTAVDIAISPLPGVATVRADLERHEFEIGRDEWDLIVCRLYWQADLMPSIAAGVRPGGVAALAGKTTGRFATSLARYREFFRGWEELETSEKDGVAVFVARRPRVTES